MKNSKEQKIITKQVSKKLEDLRPLLNEARGVLSWIDYVRLGLGMGITQLASRLGLTQSSLSSSIKLEKEGRITINKLKEIANAMECELVYGFVPRKKLEDIIHDQAVKKTLSLMEEAETHMDLEDQKVMLDKNERLKDLVEERIYSKYLWDK
jgi:predicted DNA-binding mobile mystery protein A